MTLSFFASAFTGLLHVAVPSYGLRLSRRFGIQQVGWALVVSFLGLAILNLICGPGSSISLSELTSGRSFVAILVPVLLLVGMAHVETLFRERARLEDARRSRPGQLDQLLDRRTEELADAKAEFDRELRRRDLERSAFAEKTNQERLEFGARVATAAGQQLNRIGIVMELYLKLLHAKQYEPRANRYRERLLAEAAEARQLAHQLLACGQCEPVRTQLLNLSTVLHRHLPALRKLLGPQQTLECTCPTDGPWVWADPNSLCWMLEELVRNARNAMPDTGRVSISVQRVNADPPHPGQERQANPFYALVISDTGRGMEREVQKHLAEPFFTTKPGKSTGLGLASASGLMKEHGGWLAVSSAPGHGTKVSLCFPQAVPGQPDVRSIHANTEPAGKFLASLKGPTTAADEGRLHPSEVDKRVKPEAA